MCELMGLCLARPASVHFSIREFGNRDAQNLDGWGLAWYPDRSVAIVKEPVSWRTSEYTGFLEKYHAVRSGIYLAHVRHKTVGGKPAHADTHPFMREYAGREYTFAHNGTLKGLVEAHPLSRYAPIGVTDSEYAFCLLLARIARRGRHLTEDKDFRWLHKELASLNRLGQLNCLLSDGQSLFVYHDQAAYKGLAWSAIHLPGLHTESFEDSEVQLAFDESQPIDGLIVATHPLDDSEWHPFEPGELIVAQNGLARFSSHRQVSHSPALH